MKNSETFCAHMADYCRPGLGRSHTIIELTYFPTHFSIWPNMVGVPSLVYIFSREPLTISIFVSYYF